MDYSGLVTSIKNGDDLTTGKLCAEATPILRKYLMKKFGAEPADADDAIQKMYEYIIHKIREMKLKTQKGCSHTCSKRANTTTLKPGVNITPISSIQ